VMSDLHVPYHKEAAVKLALKEAKKRRADVVLLNGDIIDCFALSRWEKDPRERNFRREVEMTRQLLEAISELFPDARKLFKLGNHEERYQSYMQLKAPELLDLDDFQFEHVLRLEEFGWECVKDCRPIRLATLNVLHGHEYRFSISNPVNPARGLFLRGKVHAMCGHFHQSSAHNEATLEDKSIACFSMGCMCDLRPRYMPLNKWNCGFSIVDVDEAGGFDVDNFRVVRGRLYT